MANSVGPLIRCSVIPLVRCSVALLASNLETEQRNNRETGQRKRNRLAKPPGWMLQLQSIYRVQQFCSFACTRCRGNPRRVEATDPSPARGLADCCVPDLYGRRQLAPLQSGFGEPDVEVGVLCQLDTRFGMRVGPADHLAVCVPRDLDGSQQVGVV